MKIYHGSPCVTIKEFNLDNKRYELVEGDGVYFTQDYRIARKYAGSEGAIYVCSLRSSAVFDATNPEEYSSLFESISKKINFDLTSLDYIEETIENLVSGQYLINDEIGMGLSWQIINLLNNDENFVSLKDSEEKIQIVKSEIAQYLQDHGVWKYNDKLMGLIMLCRNPTLIKIDEIIMVGSKEDENLL